MLTFPLGRIIDVFEQAKRRAQAQTTAIGVAGGRAQTPPAAVARRSSHTTGRTPAVPPHPTALSPRYAVSSANRAARYAATGPADPAPRWRGPRPAAVPAHTPGWSCGHGPRRGRSLRPTTPGLPEPELPRLLPARALSRAPTAP